MGRRAPFAVWRSRSAPKRLGGNLGRKKKTNPLRFPGNASLVGLRVGRLVVREFSHVDNQGSRCWLCDCDCGGTATPTTGNLRKKNPTSSCGCLRRENVAANFGEERHGYKGTPTYKAWKAMLARARHRSVPLYVRELYANVSVCERWLRFQNFLEDMGERPSGKSLDRINNLGNYEPSNCRWATAVEQANNKRPNRRPKEVADALEAYAEAHPEAPRRIGRTPWVNVGAVNSQDRRKA